MLSFLLSDYVSFLLSDNVSLKWLCKLSLRGRERGGGEGRRENLVNIPSLPCPEVLTLCPAAL